MRKAPLKRGSRRGSLSRVDPAYGAGGQANNPGDERPRSAEGVQASMVALSPSPPGRGQALSRGDSQRKHAPYEHHATFHEPRSSSGGEPDPLSESTEASAPTPPTHAPKSALLADEQWERVRALLPTQKPGQGRLRRDDRQVLRAILWVMDSGSSWRDLPEEEFGPNSTAHGRYRKWCKEGLWSRIVEALGR